MLFYRKHATEGSPAALRLRFSAFERGASIPRMYAREGQAVVSPKIEMSAIVGAFPVKHVAQPGRVFACRAVEPEIADPQEGINVRSASPPSVCRRVTKYNSKDRA